LRRAQKLRAPEQLQNGRFHFRIAGVGRRRASNQQTIIVRLNQVQMAAYRFTQQSPGPVTRNGRANAPAGRKPKTAHVRRPHATFQRTNFSCTHQKNRQRMAPAPAVLPNALEISGAPQAMLLL